MGFGSLKKRFDRASFRFAIKNQIAADRDREAVIGTWNERDDASLSEADVVLGDIFVGHPDDRWTKLYKNMIKTLGKDEALKLAEDEFPLRQLNRIRIVDDL